MSSAKKIVLALTLVFSAAVVTACADSTAPNYEACTENQGSSTRC